MLVVVMCMASVAKAQFYDSADEIYYYKVVNYSYEERREAYWNGPTLIFEKTGKVKTDEFGDNGNVTVFNLHIPEHTRSAFWGCSQQPIELK